MARKFFGDTSGGKKAENKKKISKNIDFADRPATLKNQLFWHDFGSKGAPNGTQGPLWWIFDSLNIGR